MGLYSDILESNRERGFVDPCMFIHKSKHSVDHYLPLWHHYCDINPKSQQRNRNSDFSSQVQALQCMNIAEKTYISFRYLLDMCIYREKQLLALKNHCKFTTHLVNDAVNEYLSIVRESWIQAVSEVTDAKKLLKSTPTYTFSVDDDAEKEIPVITILDSLFHYLSATAEFDDSQFLQAVFIDMSKLISLVRINTYGKKPKDICREYYESTFQPSFGIARCENCGEPLYTGWHYCFNCFERS